MSLKLRQMGNAAAEGAAGEGRNKPSRILQFGIIAAVAIVVYVGGLLLNYSPSRSAEAVATVTPLFQGVITETVVIEVTPTPTPTMLPAMDDIFRNDDPAPTVDPVVIEVTSTPTPTPVYFYVPVEVEKIVTNTITVELYPTPTPSLSPGTVRICADVEGATGLYIGGLGVVSGGCQVFTFGVGQTSIIVHVNK